MKTKGETLPFNPTGKIVETESNKVYCHGEDTHPKIYLTIDEKTGRVVCPYCNEVFIKK